MSNPVPSRSLDAIFMAEALAESRKGRFWAAPNPHVGCLLVRDEIELGRGFTQPAGGDHAEIQALNCAGDARGATAYVTLEPCAHQGRTGPCVEALIAAGIRRAVVGIQDPNPQVAGRGLKRLAEAGIEISLGLMDTEIEDELRGFLLRMTRGWGRVRLKIAASLDGRIAMASGESQWITGPEARADVQVLRAESSMIVTGVGTVLADDCALTVRSEQLPLSQEERKRAVHRKPLRVVLDSRGRTPPQSQIMNGDAPTLVLLTDAPAAQAGSVALIQDDNETDVQVLSSVDGCVDLGAALRCLGERGGNEILIEAGPQLATGFLTQGLVDELIVYQAPMLLGASARPMLNIEYATLAETLRLKVKEVTRLGTDVRIIATPNKSH